ncbi:hypothetical protein [Ruixingdingia sedimenti]|uniref:Apolipoprotein acyltransferase n=1 Tax=Ruixingdingia sedimenti TaxID=3073604 RepID=A0ABU1F4H9_9RHOB|nr:hypothetical protein [Xinfangfangia sp. LG-4]MDR5651563.1 hypothetical protein [Xinfangfangia sp. LG-4]
MFIVAGFVIGALWGGWLARSRKGTTLDIVQYAGVYAIIFALVGLLATVVMNRI